MFGCGITVFLSYTLEERMWIVSSVICSQRNHEGRGKGGVGGVSANAAFHLLSVFLVFVQNHLSI